MVKVGGLSLPAVSEWMALDVSVGSGRGEKRREGKLTYEQIDEAIRGALIRGLNGREKLKLEQIFCGGFTLRRSTQSLPSKLQHLQIHQIWPKKLYVPMYQSPGKQA